MYTCSIQISRFELVSVAEQAGLNLTLWKIPEDTFWLDVPLIVLPPKNAGRMANGVDTD